MLVEQNRLEFHQRFDGMQKQFDGLRAEVQEQNQTLRAELKEELREHRRETRIALDDLQQETNGLRQEMQENFHTLHTQMLVQTRWMIGSLVVIGAMVTLLLTIGCL